MSEKERKVYLEREEDAEVEDIQTSGQRGERSGSQVNTQRGTNTPFMLGHMPSGGNVLFQGPGNRGFIEQEAFDATDGENDGVARLAAQLHALPIEMQTLRERNQDPPSNIPTSARHWQNEYVDPGITARLGRAHACMDGPSPTGSEPDRLQTFNDDGNERSYKPKFEKPGKIVAKYSEEYNILNTIINFKLYMANHSISIEKYSQYAVSYFDEIIQLWPRYDRWYTETPEWAQLWRDLISLYLEPDHALRVLLKFEEVLQGSSLLDYVEQFQRILAAMVFAGVKKSEEELVLQFIRCL
eukprot:814406-Rhodomonas_salina.1